MYGHFDHGFIVTIYFTLLPYMLWGQVYILVLLIIDL